ncbi:hypothetical protein AOLI_G00099870 [Acnodon oligacanthus]
MSACTSCLCGVEGAGWFLPGACQGLRGCPPCVSHSLSVRTSLSEGILLSRRGCTTPPRTASRMQVWQVIDDVILLIKKKEGLCLGYSLPEKSISLAAAVEPNPGVFVRGGEEDASSAGRQRKNVQAGDRKKEEMLSERAFCTYSCT